MSKVIIVNEDDEPMGLKERDEVLEKDIYRVSGLWITNSQGEILLTQRALNKAHDPGKWGPGVAGTIEKGETYESDILKEAKEELGLSSIAPALGTKIRIFGKHNFFCQWFLARLDCSIEDFTLQKEEVIAVQWMAPEVFRKELRDYPEKYLPSITQWLNLFLPKEIQ